MPNRSTPAQHMAADDVCALVLPRSSRCRVWLIGGRRRPVSQHFEPMERAWSPVLSVNVEEHVRGGENRGPVDRSVVARRPGSRRAPVPCRIPAMS